MKKTLVFILLLALLGSTVALAETTTLSEDHPILFSVSEDQTTLTVELLGNATTGFEWVATPSSEELFTQESNEYIPDAANGAAGVGGKSVFVFSSPMKSAGEGIISFVYSRSWEDEEAESEYLLRVWVDEAGLLTITGAFERFE